MQEWKRQIQGRLKSRDDLEERFDLTKDEQDFFSGKNQGLELGITPYYFNLIGDVPDDPVRLQCIPRVQERTILPYEIADPLCEKGYSPVPRLIHRYRDRALLLVTGFCSVYCRHCFRRYFTGNREKPVSIEETQAAAAYLARHVEIKELLLSGGDPLTLDDSPLEKLLQVLREARQDLVFRVATRIPVVLPQRITPELVELLASYKPLWLVTQYNHPVELTEQSLKTLNSLIDAGVPVLNQTVLLKGVNDRVEILEELFHRLVDARVKPYYLFQGDLASGTSHFRVPLKQGIEIIKELRSRMSGLSLPVYAVDLPDGGGKVPLTESYLIREEEGWLIFRSIEGEIYKYPVED